MPMAGTPSKRSCQVYTRVEPVITTCACKPLTLADAQVADKIDFALPRGGVIAAQCCTNSAYWLSVFEPEILRSLR